MILLLGIYPEKTITQKGTCIPVYIAALFHNSQNMEATTHTHTHEYYAAIKKNTKLHLQQHGWTKRLLYRMKSEKER